MNTKTHTVNPRLFSHEITTHLVGCGGNGSHMLMGLYQLHRTLLALGHPGLHVAAFDPDAITEPNLGRQIFTEAELGQNKAVVLIHRLNTVFGLHWDGYPTRYPLANLHPPALLITCVDSKQAQADIFGRLQRFTAVAYWLDLGNGKDFGQAVIGEFQTNSLNPCRLAHVVDLYPEITEGEEDEGPSCSLAEALDHQDLFINRNLSALALQILWTMFRKGKLKYQGCFLNLTELSVVPLPVTHIGARRTRKKP